MRVFVAGASDDIKRHVGDLGHDVLIADASPIPKQGFHVTMDRLLEADLLVADVSDADTGVGWVLAWFLARGRLAVVCCRRDARERVPAIVAGNPSPWMRSVLYGDAEELRRELGAILRPERS